MLRLARVFWLGLWLWLVCDVSLAWNMPMDGYASMTHYDLPANAIAACGCTAKSDHYPTAALSSLAYNSSDNLGYGPQCGRCVKLQLINTILSDPPWYPASPPSVVIKIIDKCPFGGAWCNATATVPNAGGHYVNFDLAWPSENGALPDNFYPTNESYYGYTDFGVWNVSYTTVACEEWAGANDQAALGSVPDIGSGGCCPTDPITYPNTTCPSSDADSPPDTGNPDGSTGGGAGSRGSTTCGLTKGSPRSGSSLYVVIILSITFACCVAVHVFLPIPS